MRLGEGLARDCLEGPARRDGAPLPQGQGIEGRGIVLGQRDQPPDGRLHHAGDVEGDVGNDAGLHGLHPGNLGNLAGEGLRGALHLREDVGEAVAVVIGIAGDLQRLQCSQHQHEERNPARHHERDGQDLALHAREIAQQLSVQCAHHATTPDRAPGACGCSHASCGCGRRQS
jgi:hypothetical protein